MGHKKKYITRLLFSLSLTLTISCSGSGGGGTSTGNDSNDIAVVEPLSDRSTAFGVEFDNETIDTGEGIFPQYPIYWDEHPYEYTGFANLNAYLWDRKNWWRAYFGFDPYELDTSKIECAMLEAYEAFRMDAAHWDICNFTSQNAAGGPGADGDPMGMEWIPRLDWDEGISGGHFQASNQPTPRRFAAGYFREYRVDDGVGLGYNKIVVDHFNAESALLARAQVAATQVSEGVYTAIDVAAGGLHTCALLEGGSVRCWGAKHWGQLGDGSGAEQNGVILKGKSEPSTIVGLAEPAIDIAAGYAHTCAVLVSGAVQCWGANYYTQLGNGVDGSWRYAWELTEPMMETSPVYVVGIDNNPIDDVVSIEGSHSVMCGLKSGGDTVCWGRTRIHSPRGELALEETNRERATTITGLETATQLSPGGLHTCGLLDSGAVQCLGADFQGQLGDGDSDGSWLLQQHSPSSVVGISNAKAISSGGSHSCIIDNTDKVFCWGNGAIGQLGPGITGEYWWNQYSATPVEVALPVTPVMIETGGAHTCIVSDTSEVWCWGSKYFGKLGSGNDLPASEGEPVQVANLDKNVIAISSNHAHTCVVLDGGQVRCWGYNAFGQLGESGSFVDRSTPVIVKGF
ncbi:RCC1 domain-containing protein [Microbulbifer echini]|uniref:RCC1 domain-containing protein n=1 Tax=Microbulbifer echini TaxID=1529067 RepID=A0ABV4NLF0_9GAMM